MELYIVRIEYYHDFAIDCGASDIIGIYDNKDKAIKIYKNSIKSELKDGYIFDDTLEDILYNLDLFKNNELSNVISDMYDNKVNYDSGYNIATYVLEKRILNKSNKEHLK